MNVTNNFHPVNPKDFLSHTFSSYLYSNTKNQKDNPLSIYLSSNSNKSKPKADLNANNYVKKPLNLDIAEVINNSLNNHKKDNTSSIRHYSSFSNHNINNMNLNNTNKLKKTLILDLDETLVHSAFTPFSRKCDFILNINIEGENKTLYVLKRPHVDKFLQELSLLYEIIIFTASISQYANPLLDQLDKNNYIKYRLFREHCTFNNGIYIKDLKIFDRKINNMIIIDNNPLSYDNNIENGLPILSWYDNINDNELLRLLPLLKYMSNTSVEDVRTIINKIVDRSKNEIDYSAINKIIDTKSNNNNEILSSQNLTIDNQYRRGNKSQEPRNEISKKKEFNKTVNIYSYHNRNDLSQPLKNNFMKNYNDDENKNNYDNKLFNEKYNQNNYLYNVQGKENISNLNINIDKMDPNGIRKSIFSPEEYNMSYAKSLHYSYNTNKINNNMDYTQNKFDKNNNEENIFYNTMKVDKENKDYFNTYKNLYNYNTFTNKKENETRSLTPNINIRRSKEPFINNEDHFDSGKISRKYSLVELTKKALHLIDDESQSDNNKKENEYETINNSNTNRILYKYNNYFNKENQIIYNDYISNNKYIGNYKSSNELNKDNLNNKYFNDFIEESKNVNENNNDKLHNNKMIISKKIDSFNERFMNTDKLYNNHLILNEENKNKLLERINNEKINNFLNNNKNNNNIKLYQTGNNFYNNYMKNYNKINNDNYFSSIKKSYTQDKNDLNNNSDKNNDKKDIFINNNLNYNKNEKNNEKIYNNRYDLLDNYGKQEVSNLINSSNSISYNNLKVYPMKNNKKTNKKDNEQYDLHYLTRSSSYISSSTEIEKLLDKFSSRNNYNKENYSNNVNYKLDYEKNMDYKYELKNAQNKPKFIMDNNKYYNTFNRTNYLKY